MRSNQLRELVLQSLEHERGGVLIYKMALECVINPELRKEWEKYLEQTKEHVDVLTALCGELRIDPKEETPGCMVVQYLGKSLVSTMKLALGAGDRAAAELVACDCVTMAETKDYANWGLIGACAASLKGREAEAFKAAHEQVEPQEAEHLYHTEGWGRELWLDALGLEAVLPPPEEERHVKSAIGAARAAQQSKEMRGL